MNVRIGIVLVWASLFIAGCRTNPTIELLESELRWLEDQNYALQDESRKKVNELESCRREIESLKQKLGGTGAGDIDVRVPENVAPPPGTAEPDGGTSESEAPPFTPTTPPSIELNSTPSSPMPESIPPGNRDDASYRRRIDAAPDDEVDARVTNILLNSRLTGGHDFDGAAGDEGIMVVVQPRNAAGRYVELPAPVAVVVLDPAKTGPAARVARWDFDAAEVARRMKKTPLGRGIFLELPWPNHAPEHSRLHVFVRYTTVEGRQLEADREIAVDLPRQLSARWTPTSGPARAELRRETISTAQHDTAEQERPVDVQPPARPVPVHPGGGLSPAEGALPSEAEASRSAQEPNALSPAWTPYR